MTTGGSPNSDTDDETGVGAESEDGQLDADSSDGEAFRDDESPRDDGSLGDDASLEDDASLQDDESRREDDSPRDDEALPDEADAAEPGDGATSPASADGEATGQAAEATAASATDSAAPEHATERAASDGQTKGMDEKYCSSCGEIIKKAAEICPECGVRQSGATSSAQEKDAGIAAVLSAITGGWGGQLYNGEIGKGLGLLVLQFVNFLLLAVFVGFFTGFLVWVIGIYDAYNSAQKINRGERSP